MEKQAANETAIGITSREGQLTSSELAENILEALRNDKRNKNAAVRIKEVNWKHKMRRLCMLSKQFLRRSLIRQDHMKEAFVFVCSCHGRQDATGGEN